MQKKSVPVLLLGMLFSVATAPLWAEDAELSDFVATYNVYYTGIRFAYVERSLHRTEQNTYRFESRMRPTGIFKLMQKLSVHEHTIMRQQQGTVLPLHYEYLGNKGKDKRHMRFDQERLLVIDDIHGKNWHMNQDGQRVLDRLSQQLSLMQALRRGERPESCYVTDGRKLIPYFYRYHDNEQVSTDSGKFEALKMEQFKPGDKRRLLVWFAPGLDYQPVKLNYIEKNGMVFTALLQSLNASPAHDGAGPQ